MAIFLRTVGKVLLTGDRDPIVRGIHRVGAGRNCTQPQDDRVSSAVFTYHARSASDVRKTTINSCPKSNGPVLLNKTFDHPVEEIDAHYYTSKIHGIVDGISSSKLQPVKTFNNGEGVVTRACSRSERHRDACLDRVLSG